jgi:DNA-directed RNA polymerase subunit RPC12/RpoP
VKCIRCGTDNNLKDRTANMGRCKSCNHQFVFEPTAMTEARLTDPFFAKLITNISANNTLFFTPRQLYYLLDKRLRSNLIKTNIAANLSIIIFVGSFVAIFVSAWLHGIFGLPLDLLIPILLSLTVAFCVWTIAESALSPQVNRHIRQKSINILKVLSGVILLIGLPVSIIAKTPVGIISSIVIGICAIWLNVDRKRKQSKIFDQFLVEQPQFDEWLNKWNSINNSPEKILSPPQITSLPAAPNPEVTAYSFDRVVVCDSPKIAQLLISNNFHFENNCAILAIDRYPQSIVDTTMAMLRRNPDLKVYALHDCSPQGLQLIRRLRSEEIWFPDSAIPIIDVGVLPRQIIDNIDVMTPQSTGSAQLAQQLSPDLRNSLNPAELVWLDAGCYLELESFSPQKLIQILQRAINESRELAVIEGGDLLMMNAGFYTVESFG